ncbi:MAG: hypothetical protein QOF75_2360, partial [Gaiellaceae bacterium]|nr:hypothetical protein [Gaiellaceae bacterium]
MRGWLSPLLAGLVVLCPCAPAQAETAYLTGNGQSKTLHIDGAPGEVNQPQIWPVNDNGSLIYWVRDVTTFPVAGAGCSQWDVDVVSCPQGPVIAFNVSLGDQNDSFSTTQPLAIPMQLSGGDGNDLHSAGDGADTVSGGPGDDTIGAEGLGADVYNGGTGTDLITFGRTGNQSITLDDVANDGLAAEGDNAHSDFEAVSAGGGDDTITGTSGPDTINGGGGTDVIHGGGGDDNLTLYGCGTVDAGTGNDVITTNLACAGLAISGGDDVDRLDLSIATSAMQASLNGVADDGPIGAGAVNVPPDIENITGSPYGDVLTGDAQPNAIDGGAGDDLLDGGGGPDTLAGGNGSDAVDYSSRTVPLNVDLDGQPADDGEAGEGDTVGTDVEGIYGGSAADVLTGGPGDDLLDGGPGADQLAGGGGEDVVDYSARTAAVSADADGAVSDDGESGEGDSIAADVEDLIGGAGNDTLTGNSAANYIRGGSGNDLIAGGDGDDVLVGEDGDDSLDGGTGLDQFFADAGDDTIAMRDDVGEPAYCG